MEIELLLKVVSTVARIMTAITDFLHFLGADDEGDDVDSGDCDETDDDKMSSDELEPGGVIIEW